MSGRSLEEINAELQEVDRQLLELTTETDWQPVEQFGSDLGQVEAFLETNLEDLGEVTEGIEEYVDDLRGMGPEMEDLLDKDGVKKFIEGVTGGLDEASHVIGAVKEGLGQLGEAAAALQLGEGLTSDDAQEQIEAFGATFETVTDKLGPYISVVPGLGAFFQIYGMAITNIAESVGVLPQRVDRDNDWYETIGGRPGHHLYTTTETIKSDKIRALEFKRSQLWDEAMEAATDERIAREEAELGSGVSEVDIVVHTALTHSTDAQPQANSDEYQAWVTSSNGLEAAEEERESARANLWLATQDDVEASTRLETASSSASDTAALEANAQATAAARERTQTRMDDANGNFDQALETHNEATAVQRAEFTAYDDAVRTEIIRLIPYANASKGFDDSDYAELAREYPRWTVSPGDDSVETAEPDPPVTDSESSSAAAGAAVGATGAAAGIWSVPKRLVVGGAVGAMLLVGALFLLPNGKTPDTAAVDVQSPAGAAESPAEAAESPEGAAENPPAAAETVDVCAVSELGCQDIGTLPEATIATYTWSATSCEETLESFEQEAVLTTSSLGARMSLPPFGAVRIGGGDVIGLGGGGGSVTRDGVTTATRIEVDVTSVNSDGFTARIERLTGPADDAGNLDPSQTECEQGGILDFTIDADEWATRIGSPTSDEPPFTITDFACRAQTVPGAMRLSWAAAVQSAVPDPQTPLRAEAYWYYPANADAHAPIFNSTMDPAYVWDSIPGHEGTEIPEDLKQAYESGGVWGYVDFNNAEFSEDDLVDAQIRIQSGVFGVSAPSRVCPWQ